MSDLGLYIDASALNAQQIGMDVVSQDMANVNTPEYARETPNMQTFFGSSYGVGGGVSVPSVSQVTNSIITSSAITADGMLSQTQALYQTLNQVQALFPEPNGGGLQSQLSQFWSNWDAVGNEPSNAGARQALVTSAQQVASTISQTYNSLNNLQSQTVSSLNTTISQANTQLNQVAQLNQQIVITKASNGDANSLIDQRRAILDQLSQSIGITYRDNPDGAATVYLGGLIVVQDNQTLKQAPPTPIVPLTVTTSGSGSTLTAQVVYTADSTANVVALGGSAAGLIASLPKIGNYMGQLNNVATTLTSQVNNQQASGYYWAGGAGSAPSGTGATSYAGNVDTSGNPLAIFVNSLSGSAAGVNASNIGVDSEVAANPFYLAASNQTGTTDSIESTAITPVSTTISAANNTVIASINGAPVTFTLASGTYTNGTGPGSLSVAVQNAINAAGYGADFTATQNPAGYLVIQSTAALPGPQSVQITGGTAIASIGISAMSVPMTPSVQQNNGINAQQMAEQANNLAGADPIYQSLVSQIGSDVSTANSTMNAQQTATQNADQIQQALSGVSTDAETVAMQMYQNAYQATSKVIATAQTMFQSLLAAT